MAGSSRRCAEIGEVIAGTGLGRQTAEEVTLFKSVGVAVEDVVVADMVYRAAVEQPDTRALD
jgi:ornithine cyclodeaminase/alanine dehydrogenase-like protein (mu-crystallin family)